ncbi:bile acid:sodium symporter family protein [Advenella mimigardefordensis]|uniref:Putative bile acid:sodium symporter family protein n=1 Tax=Advenella mimigardefordensis (strain DSM 17166 / LMG 22922 / DPN7) TaxID=1247726 RepID=W0PES9_ADVMD|nr:bile acid:sodium symporter family protein [Advenella mimigardefordensis]AHG63578.1 putative bile acid:sodium symporter family protein [Advenella mimigardefordensis DPN7]
MSQSLLRFLKIDRFTLLLIIAVIIASVLPAHGQGMPVAELVTNLAIALLFFLHGSRLSRQAIIAGATHWRLHLVIFSCTFILFPLLGVLLRPVLEPMLTPDLYKGVLYLCVLPATVQSAIAFTSIARGNIPAAVCSASSSSILGIFITPMLVNLLIADSNASADPNQALEAIGKITLQLLVPFALGHLSRPWTSGFIGRHASLMKFVDQGSILLVVYVAFSEAVNEGLWHKTPIEALVAVVFVSVLLLGLVLLLTSLTGRLLGFSLEDRITLVFCGSKKSLASGLPMAQVLFAGQAVGAIILPLMIFHQIQLMVCAVIAARLGKRPQEIPVDQDEEETLLKKPT